MTQTLTHQPARVRTAGTVCWWAGLLGAAAAAVMIVVPPAVDEDRWSFPFDPSVYAVVQVLFSVQHLGLVVGLVALAPYVGRSAAGRLGLGGAVLGMAVLAGMELWAITARNSAYPTPRTDVIETWYGVVSTFIGLALVVAGTVLARGDRWGGRWRGWQRWLPLALGVYVFVPLTPGIFGPYWLARLVIGGWMVLFALLGRTLAHAPRE